MSGTITPIRVSALFSNSGFSSSNPRIQCAHVVISSRRSVARTSRGAVLHSCARLQHYLHAPLFQRRDQPPPRRRNAIETQQHNLRRQRQIARLPPSPATPSPAIRASPGSPTPALRILDRTAQPIAGSAPHPSAPTADSAPHAPRSRRAARKLPPPAPPCPRETPAASHRPSACASTRCAPADSSAAAERRPAPCCAACHSRSTQLSQSSIGGVAHTRLPASRCRSAYSRRSQRAARTFAVRTVAPFSNALSISMGSRIKP